MGGTERPAIDVMVMAAVPGERLEGATICGEGGEAHGRGMRKGSRAARDGAPGTRAVERPRHGVMRIGGGRRPDGRGPFVSGREMRGVEWAG
jgi:hypothetical protein